MLFLNESRMADFQGESGKILVNVFAYILSDKIDAKDADGALSGVMNLSSLRPSAALIKQYKNNDISESKFRDLYKEELTSYENKFLIYMIVRAIGERQYMPLFLYSDEDEQLGYIDVLKKMLKKKFGLKPVKAKEYKKAVKAIWKAAKKSSKKKKGVRKAAKKMLKEYVSDNLQLSNDGFKKLGDMEQKFAIDRIVLSMNQLSDGDEIGKKTIVNAIKDFADYSKKYTKIVKKSVEELGISKKSDRWSRKDAANLAVQVYNNVHAAMEGNSK